MSITEVKPLTPMLPDPEKPFLLGVDYNKDILCLLEGEGHAKGIFKRPNIN